jgi:quercetin dioxygenase-like cupin family protein
MAKPNRMRNAADRASHGFGCDLWADPPGQAWEDFRHATDELVTVLGGETEFEVASVVHNPKMGDELLIPAGAAHSAQKVSKTAARWPYGYRRPG